MQKRNIELGLKLHFLKQVRLDRTDVSAQLQGLTGGRGHRRDEAAASQPEFCPVACALAAQTPQACYPAAPPASAGAPAMCSASPGAPLLTRLTLSALGASSGAFQCGQSSVPRVPRTLGQGRGHCWSAPTLRATWPHVPCHTALHLPGSSRWLPCMAP